MRLDPTTGIIVGDGIVHSVRTLANVAGIFAEPGDPTQVIYETYSMPEPSGAPDLLVATTILHPGRVGREAHMTRGHFHVNPERGETCLTLRGSGILLLRDRDGHDKQIPMTPGALHVIDGRMAHRVANVGDEPLVFFVSWMSDCGHDYASVAAWPRGSWSVVL